MTLASGGVIYVGGDNFDELEGASAVGLTDVFLTKWTETGATRQRVWSRQFGTSADDRLTDIAVHEGAIYMGGRRLYSAVG